LEEEAMKIILLNQMHIKTGIGSYIEIMKNFFKKANIEYKIITLSYDNRLDEYSGEIYKGFDFPFYKEYLNPVFSNIVYRNIKRKLKDYKTEGYIIHYGSNSMTPITDYDIVTLHDIGFKDSYKNAPTYKQLAQYYGYFFIFKKFLKFDNIIVSTNVLKNELINEYRYNSNIFVVPHYYNPSFKPLENRQDLIKKLKLPQNKKLILSVGADKPNKNIQILGKVMDILGEEYKLVRIGPSVGNSITINNLALDEMNNVYNACDVLVFPSLDEGFGFPIIEAFATGLPVVASDIPVFHEIGGDAPIYVNNRDPESIANGIRYAIANKDEMAMKSLERSKLYTLWEFNKKMISVYKKI
jgi:glycosyltransferase involved in cell wall biosynthesis